MRVSPVSTTKVRSAENSATPTATGPSQRVRLFVPCGWPDRASAETILSAVIPEDLEIGWIWASAPNTVRIDVFIQHCCAIATIRRQAPAGRRRQSPSVAGPDHLDIEVPYLLAQGVPVDPQEVGRTDLISA